MQLAAASSQKISPYVTLRQINSAEGSIVEAEASTKINKRPELWQTECPDPPVKKKLSFGSFGFCRELVMSSDLRDS